MNITYNDKTDLLYIRLDENRHDVINKRLADDIVIDIDENDKIIAIEIMNASRNMDLKRIFPIEYKLTG